MTSPAKHGIAAALGALAWYIRVRLPSLPRWLVWGWLMTVPWTLQYSTHIINPSYVLPAAIVFFIHARNTSWAFLVSTDTSP